jgi:hypothetical protein
VFFLSNSIVFYYLITARPHQPASRVAFDLFRPVSGIFSGNFALPWLLTVAVNKPKKSVQLGFRSAASHGRPAPAI